MNSFVVSMNTFSSPGNYCFAGTLANQITAFAMVCKCDSTNMNYITYLFLTPGT